MIEFFNEYIIALIVLLFCIIMAIIRVIKGPTAPDRIVGLDTINTIVIISMVIFGFAFNSEKFGLLISYVMSITCLFAS